MSWYFGELAQLKDKGEDAGFVSDTLARQLQTNRFVGNVRAAYDRLQHDSPATPWLAQQLASLVDTGECLIASVTAIAGADGRTRFGGRGMLQDMLDEAVRHPKIDLRRFARCQVCHAFFYRPRKRSRTCSRKCENILAAREHYAREQETRAKALELDSQGKNAFQIGRELGIKTAKVGSYLARSRRQEPTLRKQT